MAEQVHGGTSRRPLPAAAPTACHLSALPYDLPFVTWCAFSALSCSRERLQHSVHAPAVQRPRAPRAAPAAGSCSRGQPRLQPGTHNEGIRPGHQNQGQQCGESQGDACVGRARGAATDGPKKSDLLRALCAALPEQLGSSDTGSSCPCPPAAPLQAALPSPHGVRRLQVCGHGRQRQGLGGHQRRQAHPAPTQVGPRLPSRQSERTAWQAALALQSATAACMPTLSAAIPLRFPPAAPQAPPPPLWVWASTAPAMWW